MAVLERVPQQRLFKSFWVLNQAYTRLLIGVSRMLGLAYPCEEAFARLEGTKGFL